MDLCTKFGFYVVPDDVCGFFNADGAVEGHIVVADIAPGVFRVGVVEGSGLSMGSL